MRPIEDVDFTGRHVGQYAVLSLVGSGSMGKVYWARDERLRRDVAIKVVGGVPASRPAHGNLLMNEARTLSRLNHPHVAGMYEYLTEDDSEFLVMEFVPGATLRDVLAGGPLPTPEVVRLGGQLVRGLAAAHDAKVLHQDIKPSNIKVTSSGDLKILDFGIARLLPGAVASLDAGEDTTSSWSVRGTVPYMAPERINGDPVDERSDIFSAGCVLYEMAAGRRAYPQKKIGVLIDTILRERPAPLATVNPLVPKALEAVVMRAMASDPRHRQQSANALADELAALPLTMAAAPPPMAPAPGPMALLLGGWASAVAG